MSVCAFGFISFFFFFWKNLNSGIHLREIFGFGFYFPLAVFFSGSFLSVFLNSKPDFLYSNVKTGPRLSEKKEEKSPRCPQIPAWFVSSTAWITDCPPHSTTSSLLLHDLLPLTPPLFFSFSVPVYMLLICFIYWDIFNELRDCNVAVYTASLANKNKDVMQLPGVWDLHS